jgi:hypothetical protein
VLTDELKFDYVIRFRGNITVTAADGETRTAREWVGKGGRARVLRGATVTAVGYPVGTVVCVQAKGMKEAWCIATNTTESGRIEARTGLRMMPTSPRSPLSFRTAGFPQYGWKAGLSDGAFPCR